MLRLDLSEKFDKTLNIVSIVSTIAVTVIGAILKIENSYFANPLILAIIAAIRNRAWWLILAFSLTTIFSQYIRSRIGTDVVWQTVQYLLDQYREELFGSKDDEAQFFHRITLFKHVRWHWGLVCWPWSGWMIPVARSGNKTRKHIAKFRASSDDPDNAEGIAGQAWANERPVQICGLPDINTGETSKEDLGEYANKSLVEVKWLQTRKKKNKNNARSMLGIPVEVKGKTWGAMVVDSRSPDEILSETALKKQKYKTLVNILAKLLEKV